MNIYFVLFIIASIAILMGSMTRGFNHGFAKEFDNWISMIAAILSLMLISGIIGTVAAVWLYWNFCNWLNVLNCTLPPVGIILILSYFCNRKAYLEENMPAICVNWFAVFGVIAGAVVANLVKWGIPSINGMAVAAVLFLIGERVRKNKLKNTETL